MQKIQFLLANYNSSEHIEILIKSLRTFHPGFSYEILACDNGSTDGSDQYLASRKEVKLWRLSERPDASYYNRKQQEIVARYGLNRYIQDYLNSKVLKCDYRRSHQAALNFLLTKVASPVFFTLDSDIEFLNPYWAGHYLMPMLSDPNIACVGFQEDSLSFAFPPFRATVKERIHPCLALWRTADVLNTNGTWDASDEFDLRFAIIHKCIAEQHPISLTFGDTGHDILDKLKNSDKKLHCLSAKDFAKCCRHFYGATVDKVWHDPSYNDWIDELLDQGIENLALFMQKCSSYGSYTRKAMLFSQKFWSNQQPPLREESEIPVIVLQ